MNFVHFKNKVVNKAKITEIEQKMDVVTMSFEKEVVVPEENRSINSDAYSSKKNTVSIYCENSEIASLIFYKLQDIFKTRIDLEINDISKWISDFKESMLGGCEEPIEVKSKEEYVNCYLEYAWKIESSVYKQMYDKAEETKELLFYGRIKKEDVPEWFFDFIERLEITPDKFGELLENSDSNESEIHLDYFRDLNHKYKNCINDIREKTILNMLDKNKRLDFMVGFFIRNFESIGKAREKSRSYPDTRAFMILDKLELKESD